jgi:SAM-dependent methyltransferase
MNRLYAGLAALHAQASREEWLNICASVRAHPLHELLLQSPFTRRAFQKPRGYAGDAEIIDFIYGCPVRSHHRTTLGESLYSWEFEMPGCRSVRHRRVLFAREIDKAAANRATTAVLSIACGHLREAELSVAVRHRSVNITALDQDRASLAVVAREYGAFGVTAQPGTIGDVLKRRVTLAGFNLTYASGLYDYLEAGLATKLTAALFQTLAPGGRLIIANFTPNTQEAGYIEACMDWHLIYRNEQQMGALTASVPSAQIAGLGQYRDPDANVTYMSIVRR